MTKFVEFVQGWSNDPNAVKPVFLHLKDVLQKCEGSTMTFKPRPGISYSLRGGWPESDREMFVMVDVVDDDPEDRWLSVCFYDDQVTDPDELGDWAPSGLGDQDARCFTLENDDSGMVAYTEARIHEAWNASKTA